MQTKKGFLIVELMLVIALIAFLAMIGIHSFDYLHTSLVRIEAERLYAFIVAERACAMTLNKPHELLVNANEGTITGTNIRDVLAKNVYFAVPNGVYGPPSQPKTLIKKACTFVDNKIIIEPQGTMNAGTLYLTNAQKSCCYALTVPTGPYPFLRIYRYSHKKWHIL